MRRFFGNSRGDEMNMLFDFQLSANLWLGFARHRAEPVARALRSRQEIPSGCQYAVFLRHHDELNLEELSEAECQEIYAAFAPDEDMRAYDRGVCRRLLPMLGDEARAKLAFSLLFSLPGTPVLLYGDEIGLGDDLPRPGRQSVRVPMQWTDSPGEASPALTNHASRASPRMGRTATTNATSAGSVTNRARSSTRCAT